MGHALHLESKRFAAAVTSAACRNSIRAFFLKDAARKRTLEGWFDRPTQPPPRLAKIGVVGAGVMGGGIAECLAAHGYSVVLHDSDPDCALRADRFIARGAGGETLAHLATTTDLAELRDCELVIEAITEDLAAKQALFRQLASIVAPATILASNSSALPIEEIAAGLPHPERTLGLHFFNPVARMALVELIVGPATKAATAEASLGLLRSLGKSPVICRSSPGLLVTRILFFYLNAALRLWEEGVPLAMIDLPLREFGWPMGPLRLVDEVGLDVTTAILRELARYFPHRFDASAVPGSLLAAGLRGRKNGQGAGFYRYEGKQETPNERAESQRPRSHGPPASPDEIVARLMGALADEASLCLREGVVKSADDVDFALLSGAAFPAARGSVFDLCLPAAQLSPRI